jgi:hypothetical protein
LFENFLEKKIANLLEKSHLAGTSENAFINPPICGDKFLLMKDMSMHYMSIISMVPLHGTY